MSFSFPPLVVAKQGTRPGQGVDKRADTVDKKDRQTWTKDQKRKRRTHTGCKRGNRSRRRTPGGLEKDSGFASAARGRTTGGQEARRGQDKDKRRTRGERRKREGQEEDKRRTREGQQEDKRRIQTAGGF